MSDQPHQKVSSLISLLLIATIICLGIFFRLSNLSTKVFWVDEVATAIRVSGSTILNVTDELLQQDLVDRHTLLSYQNLNTERTFRDSWEALTKSPEHAPLYFLLVRLWRQCWGNSIAVIRSLSVIFSLLILPSLNWLCQELFKRSPNKSQALKTEVAPSHIAWLAMGIITISPFYVAYAQEARPYSLWTVTILLMGASFIRALRLNSPSAWLLHIGCLILSFYTSLFSIYLAGFQGLYLILQGQQQGLKLIKNYAISLLIALVAFSPWIWIIINHLGLFGDNTSWMRGNFNLAEIIAVYIGTTLLIFGDLPLSPNSNPIHIAAVLLLIVFILLLEIKLFSRWKNQTGKFILYLLIPIIILLSTQFLELDWTTIIGSLVGIGILSLSAYSLYYLITQTNRDRWLYLICLMLALPLPLLIADIINQGQSSTAPRYLIPWQLGIAIAVAYTFASKLNTHKSRFWQFTLAGFIVLGIFSNLRNLNSAPFYQKNRNANNPAIAKIINQSNAALVIVEDTEAMDALSLA